MRLCRTLFLFLALVTTASLSGQDTHYTLHNYAPLWLNPANTGSFYGSVRLGGIYRGQWYTLDGIQSPTGYVDAPLPFALRKQDWIGVGLSLVTDKAKFEGVQIGDATPGVDLTQNFFGFSLAYHLSFDKKRQNVLTIGAQYGSISYGGDFQNILRQEGNISFAPGYVNDNFNEFMATPMTGGGGTNNQNNKTDESVNSLNAGLKLKLLLNEDKENIWEIGVSMYHLTSPDRRSVFTVEDRDTSTTNPNPNPGQGNPQLRERKATIHAHTRLDMEMNEKWRFQPTAYFQQSAATSSLSLQAWGQRELKRDLDLRLGLGYRTGDAVQVLAGLNFGQLRTALSYDITVSQAREATNYQGAFELSAAYIFNIYKKPDLTPTILCPDI